jgi:hypothetical protein
MATMSRLGAALEPPFQGIRLIFAVEPDQDGFTLTVGASGRPRTTRLLRHLAVGYIRAAATSSAGATVVKLYPEIVGDRAVIACRLEHASPSPPTAKAPSRRPSAVFRAPRSSLSQEVERILGPSSHRPGRRPSGSFKPEQPEAGDPQVDFTEQEEDPEEGSR